MGANHDDINYVTDVGIEEWLAEQFEMPGSSYLEMTDEIIATKIAELIPIYGDSVILHPHFVWLEDNTMNAFWQKLMTEDDYLRQRVALALSEIFVISHKQIRHATELSSFHDVLFENAFGNYRDLLLAVSLHPSMGRYLGHIGNPKTDEANNIHPDENFAREVMQLFSIGLFELNNDGTEKLDEYGQPIPTYTNEHIVEFAKVFTGLSGDGAEYFNDYDYDRSLPMIMWTDENGIETQHEQGPKYLLNNFTVPAGQSGMEDIEDAIDNLFNHSNVGPFIGYRLIQFLVKSNPTPAYVNRVAVAFNNNGQGVRGDLQAVVRAILTDPEARNCEWIDDIKTGKLREPILRLAQIYKAFKISNESERYWHRGDWSEYKFTKQSFQNAPTVFNFFSPSYVHSGVINDNNMVSPEFQILDANTSIGYINLTQSTTQTAYFNGGNIMSVRGTIINNVENYNYGFNEGPDDEIHYNFTEEINILDNEGFEGLMEHLDMLLCHGQMEESSKSIIINTVSELNETAYDMDNLSPINQKEQIIKWFMYYILISPDYIILK